MHDIYDKIVCRSDRGSGKHTVPFEFEARMNCCGSEKEFVIC